MGEAWAAGRVTDDPPTTGFGGGARAGAAARGSVYVRDLVDRGVVFVCRHDRRSRELVVITLWEDERLGPPRVARRFTDALKPDDERPRQE